MIDYIAKHTIQARADDKFVVYKPGMRFSMLAKDGDDLVSRGAAMRLTSAEADNVEAVRGNVKTPASIPQETTQTPVETADIKPETASDDEVSTEDDQSAEQPKPKRSRKAKSTE